MNQGLNRANIPDLLRAVNAGQPGASDQLAAAIYDDLRAMAHRHLAKDFGPNTAGVTIQPTVLATDTLMRLRLSGSPEGNPSSMLASALPDGVAPFTPFTFGFADV